MSVTVLRIIFIVIALVDDRKKFVMESADPQIRSEWRGQPRGRQAKPLVEENRF